MVAKVSFLLQEIRNIAETKILIYGYYTITWFKLSSSPYKHCCWAFEFFKERTKIVFRLRHSVPNSVLSFLPNVLDTFRFKDEVDY